MKSGNLPFQIMNVILKPHRGRFVPDSFACYLTANSFLGSHLAVCFRKVIFHSHHQNDVDAWVVSKHAIYFVWCLTRLRTFSKILLLLNNCYGKYSQKSSKRSVTVAIWARSKGKRTNISHEIDAYQESDSSFSGAEIDEELKQQVHGALTLLAGVNVDIGLYQKVDWMFSLPREGVSLPLRNTRTEVHDITPRLSRQHVIRESFKDRCMTIWRKLATWRRRSESIQTISTGSIPAMFSLGFSDFGEEKRKKL